MQNLKEQCVVILGLGTSGLAMAQWCTRLQARVVVVDTRAEPPALDALEKTCPQAHFLHAELTQTVLERSAKLTQNSQVTAVFVSPGVSPEAVAPLQEAARHSGVYFGGELNLFVFALEQLKQTQDYRPQILAVTGTNGKTTTVSLCQHLLQNMNVHTVLAGNVGPSLLETLAICLDPTQGHGLPAVWVLELSSFQLHSLHDDTGFNPDVATVLNLSVDHLDWHPSLEHYVAAKAKIFGKDTLRVCNRDDTDLIDALTELGVLPAKAVAEAVAVDTGLLNVKKGKKKTEKPKQADVCAFGSDAPIQGGDFGLLSEGGVLWLAYVPKTESKTGQATALMPVQALRIQGQHNALNALAALALCHGLGQDLGGLLQSLRSYSGEPHRTESIAIWEGVEYFNDSKGTNVGASLAALHGLGKTRKLIPILGGVGKGQDFQPLVPALEQYARAVVLLGRDAKHIEQLLRGASIPVLRAQSMEDAVRQAADRAQAGDAVLLSPACASFDMFDDYLHRGHVFSTAVQALALGALA